MAELVITEEQEKEMDTIADDAAMTLSSAEEYFDGVAYKLEAASEDALFKNLIAEVFNDDGTPGARYKIDFSITPL